VNNTKMKRSLTSFFGLDLSNSIRRRNVKRHANIIALILKANQSPIPTCVRRKAGKFKTCTANFDVAGHPEILPKVPPLLKILLKDSI
jgi:hypothetical protein